MKKALVLALVVLCGCASYEGKTLRDYMEHPSLLVKDPHYGEYQEKRNELERQYLYDEIGYAEYMTKREDLDAEYSRQVQKRENILAGDAPALP